MNVIDGDQFAVPIPKQGIAPNEWRGKCLDLYSRAERTVSKTLEVAREVGLTSSIDHLAGNRLGELEAAIGRGAVPSKLKRGLNNAIAEWKEVEQNRFYLAHGIMRVSLDRERQWVLLIDARVYRSNEGTDYRWPLLEKEALDFMDRLQAAFENLSSRLGNLREHLTGAQQQAVAQRDQ
ncbi:hypothetical protein [Aurantiacibacter gilvus]|uniref:Uncharacterized protein n=1 Tax=Aurantiacibacter gilvus TaxID=3139141 RepID=A0ABU9II79_9SPHN